MADYLVKILGDLLHKDAPEDDIDHLPSPHQLINKVCEFNIFETATCILNYFIWKCVLIYRVTLKEWDFRDDCMKFYNPFFLHWWFPA